MAPDLPARPWCPTRAWPRLRFMPLCLRQNQGAGQTHSAPGPCSLLLPHWWEMPSAPSSEDKDVLPGAQQLPGGSPHGVRHLFPLRSPPHLRPRLFSGLLGPMSPTHRGQPQSSFLSTNPPAVCPAHPAAPAPSRLCLSRPLPQDACPWSLPGVFYSCQLARTRPQQEGGFLAALAACARGTLPVSPPLASQVP